MYPDPKDKSALQAFWKAGREKPKRKKGFYFMDLPGEIRNLIYSYVYAEDIILDLCGKRNDIKEAKTPKDGKTIRFPNALGSYGHGHFENVKWKTSIPAFHLTDSQISAECVAFLYRKLTLVSRQPALSIAFFDNIRPFNLQYIRRLQLHHSTYGEPKDPENIKFKAKADCKWTETCILVMNCLPDLRELCINLLVNDSPFRLNLEERWVRPLLYFRKLEKLDKVDIHIFSRWRRETAVDKNNERMWHGHPPHIVRQMIRNHEGNGAIHELFGRAIAMKIKGFCDDCAMEKMIREVNGKWRNIARQAYWEEWIEIEQKCINSATIILIMSNTVARIVTDPLLKRLAITGSVSGPLKLSIVDEGLMAST